MKDFNENYLAISGFQKFVTCPRQWAIRFLEDSWVDNHFTIAGTLAHHIAHNTNKIEMRPNKIIARALDIYSHRLNLYGQTDIVEFHKTQHGIKLNNIQGEYKIFPIEYKNGNGQSIEADKIQLCAQGICLEEMFNCQIDSGAIYYKKNNKKINIDLNDSLRKKVMEVRNKMFQLRESKISPRAARCAFCHGCSYENTCLPKVINKDVNAYIQKFLKD